MTGSMKNWSEKKDGYHSNVGQPGELSYTVHNSRLLSAPYTLPARLSKGQSAWQASVHNPGNFCPALDGWPKSLLTPL